MDLSQSMACDFPQTPSKAMAPPIMSSTPSVRKTTFDFPTLQNVVSSLKLPSTMWGTHTSPGEAEDFFSLP